MRFINIIFLVLFAACSKGQITINAPGQPSTMTVNAPGQPSTATINSLGDTVELYIFAGQSNVGRSRVSEMTGGEAALYSGVIPGAKILNPYINDSALYQLNVGSNTMLDDADFVDEFGAEASLLKTLYSESKKHRYLLKYGDGATSMQAFWSACANRPGWLNLLNYTENIVTLILAEGKVPVLKAFIWMQGEGDSGSESFANNYGWRLQCFFDDFKTYWNGLVVANSLPADPYKVVIGRINSPTNPYRDTVRTAQAEFCAIPGNNAVMIDTDSYPLKDIVHYSATGNISFGLDIKNAID